MFGKAFHGLESRLAQAGFVRAARRGGDQVDVGFTRHRAIAAPADGPGRAGAGREVLVIGSSVFFGGKERGGQFAFDLPGEILRHAVFKLPAFLFAVGQGEGDVQARQKYRLAAQQAFEFGLRDGRRIEELGVRPGSHLGTARAFWCVTEALQGFDHRTTGKDDAVTPAVTGDIDLHAHRQRVGDRDADTMQTAGEAVGRIAVVLVEFAARVQLGEYHFNRRRAFDRVNFHRNAAPVVLHGNRTVRMQGDVDILAITAERFVGSVVDHFLDDVQRVVGAGIHAWPVTNRLQALQYGN